MTQEILIWAAALQTVVRYAAAFIASCHWNSRMVVWLITILMGISGIGMGVLDVIGGAYLIHGLAKENAKEQ